MATQTLLYYTGHDQLRGWVNDQIADKREAVQVRRFASDQFKYSATDPNAPQEGSINGITDIMNQVGQDFFVWDGSRSIRAQQSTLPLFGWNEAHVL